MKNDDQPCSKNQACTTYRLKPNESFKLAPILFGISFCKNRIIIKPGPLLTYTERIIWFSFFIERTF
ncbi:Putative protein [Zobellia galactanivorans]|uniref:Uncharacterized protein n=1 Tax=Zobellia galactanivorans (strain DSM 12802 / CCUG 47099 / CIP 106680 / NCIMB 13871 / Dsij) TaxID=63186 RepID=G0L6Z3_ZOBGA|nr:Putative protein [Zobellia galactanivorans]